LLLGQQNSEINAATLLELGDGADKTAMFSK
jgi:hypothetical protein